MQNGIRSHQIKVVKGCIVIFAFVAALIWVLQLLRTETLTEESSLQTEVGLTELPCWFEAASHWPEVTCYQMHVPENHLQADRIISFPVIHFKSFPSDVKKPPLLHLGAGGPGAAMWLHLDGVVELIWQDFEHSVLRQGRDLYLMDPRGTGLAVPKLNCPSATSFSLSALNQRLSLNDYSEAETKLFVECIKKLQQQGIDVAAYNSLSVVKDLKLLQQALALDTWSLFGVSYAAIYALLYTNEAPERIDTLILDSPAFPAMKNFDNPAARFLASLRQLENYCQFDSTCTEPLDEFPLRLWRLVEKLDAEPIKLSVPSGFLWMNLPIQLTGELFLAVMYWATYDDGIYRELPELVKQLEQGDVSGIFNYLNNYVFYIKDQNSSVVSMISHLCFDEVPFVDHAKLLAALNDLPDGFIRDSAIYSFLWPTTMCGLLGEVQPNKRLIKQTETDIPTLFLQGKLDTVTPLSDVLVQRPFFSRSQLRVYALSHAVHGRLDCVDKDLSAFLKAPFKEHEAAECSNQREH